MGKAGNKFVNGMKGFGTVLWIFIAIFAVVAVFCFQYYNNLSSTIKDESKGYLQEVSRRIGSNIDRIISDNFAVLNSMTSIFEQTENISQSDAQSILKAQQSYWNYQNILFIEKSGHAYDIDNREIFLTIDNAVRDDILSGRQAMSTTQTVNNIDYILFSVPFENVVINGREIAALAAIYDPVYFDQVLSMNSFDERAYSQIITKSGTLVTRPTSSYSMNTGYNIFTSLESAQIDEANGLQIMQDDIANNRTGQIGFTLDGTHRYVVYTPIQPEDWYLLTFVPVQVVNEKSDMLLSITLILCGVITFAFAALIATLVYIFSKHRRRLEQIAYVDDITGGNTIQRFYILARRLLDGSDKKYALVYTNIEKFKVLNEQLGRKNCDTMLKCFYDCMNSTLTENECISRLSADNFCIFMEYSDDESLLRRIDSWNTAAEEYVTSGKMQWTLPQTEMGIYIIDNNSLDFTQMIDRAKLALKDSVRHTHSKLRYAFYNDGMRHQLMREKQLEDMMEKALANNEFQVYLQPKYRLPEETIGGAEALVRWSSPDEGMIFPNEFIPLFEKNGFIVDLDIWVFEEVCRTMRKWLDGGLQPMKISINCSRVHFRDPGFLAPYIKAAEQYKIDKKLIEIELTESVVLEDVGRLTRIIDKIRETGFGCSMDDFGSGYSSLNLIQSIPVDTLKLDKIFFDASPKEIARTEAVVGSIIGLAKALSMETVAEGVEIREQVDMLKRVGCDYIQGYVFAKPMKIRDFEKLAFGRIEL